MACFAARTQVLSLTEMKSWTASEAKSKDSESKAKHTVSQPRRSSRSRSWPRWLCLWSLMVAIDPLLYSELVFTPLVNDFE